MSLLLLFDDDDAGSGPVPEVQGFRAFGYGVKRQGGGGVGIKRADGSGTGIKKAGGAGTGIIGLLLALGLALAAAFRA